MKKNLFVSLIVLMLAACNMPNNQKFLPTMQAETTPTAGPVFLPTVISTPSTRCYDISGMTVWEEGNVLDLFVHFWPVNGCQQQVKIAWSLILDGTRYSTGNVISNPLIGDHVAFSIQIPINTKVIEVELESETFQIPNSGHFEFNVIR